MKKTFLMIAAFALVFTAAEAKSPKKTEVKAAPQEKIFTNSVDSMSYALGLNLGADFAKNIKTIPGGQCNVDLLIKAFSTAMKGDSALMAKEFANTYFRSYMMAAQTKDAAAKKEAGEKFLAENKTKEGVKTTASGLQYIVLKEGTGVKPKDVDTVVVHYTGTLIDGTKFDSSVDRGEPITFPLNGVIKGWTEGVQLMTVGSKYKFFIPYSLGYGEQGAGNGVIPPYATLVFEVELLNVKPYKEPVKVEEPAKPAEDVKAAKPAAKKAPAAKAKK
ncbi:FKBP-type peptidyl-prolyl cis-trans isomerase [Paludibacter sp.]|uniref:FKBP-type peptidyl-prolyl cis-trans isomerase n=1 Tax=Paludibacter sp. TaxID=1898105 RepID=UPI00135218AE|nr:FKBP-type peptidyl-prolyl cis-trans isomerase [Paludibacter sp.]MTK52111.1 FKBP-type peptidyl-prolyl cis-trans isomerase [Paludibacter sp.]